MVAPTTVPGILLTGLHAARPVATTVGPGALYSCSTHSLIYQSDGAVWTTWATLGGDSSGLQPLDEDLTAFAGLAIAADKLPYGTGSHTLGLTDLTSFARTLLDDGDASTARTTLGITSGAAAEAIPVVDVALRADENGGAVTALPSLYVNAGNVSPASAANVVDGDDASWAAVTGGSTDRGFRVDLGAAKLVTSWRVSNGNRAAKLQYSRDDSSWNDVASGTVAANATSTGTCDIVARYWRVIGTAAGGDWTLNTINLYGYQPPEVAAAGTASSEAAYVNPASNVLDGDDSTWTAWQGGNTGKWVAVDLGSAKRVRLFRVVMGGQACELQWSADNVTWRHSNAVNIAANATTVGFVDVTARYWRIKAWHRQNLDVLIYTIQLFGDTPAATTNGFGVPSAAVVQCVQAQANAASIANTLTTPLSSYIFVAFIGQAGNEGVVQGIAQTNVAWGRVKRASGPSSAWAEWWIGYPTGGTPGTTVTATLSASNFVFMATAQISGIAGRVIAAEMMESRDNGTAHALWAKPFVPSSGHILLAGLKSDSGGFSGSSPTNLTVGISNGDDGALAYVIGPPAGPFGWATTSGSSTFYEGGWIVLE